MGGRRAFSLEIIQLRMSLKLFQVNSKAPTKGPGHFAGEEGGDREMCYIKVNSALKSI